MLCCAAVPGPMQAASAIKSCEDAAMNDKTLKCITMMSHEIKAIHRNALCEKYGNNIAHRKQNSPPHMKYVIRGSSSFGGMKH